MARVNNVLLATAPALLLAGTANAELQCAPPGVAYCSSSGDMATINSAAFALNLAQAGANAFILEVSGAEALQDVVGQDALSLGCLSCQGAMLDCSGTQTQCFEACAESSCSRDCKRCIEESCSVQKACGGVPGETLQYPFTCSNPADSTNLAVDKSLLNVPFKGSCSSSEHFNVGSINIPIRNRGSAKDEDIDEDIDEDSIVIPVKNESVPDGEVLTKNEAAEYHADSSRIFLPGHQHRRPWAMEGLRSASSISAQMQCAPSGVAYCASSQDMGVINNAVFATHLTTAAAEVFINRVPGTQAIEGTIGTGSLTPGCLACQGVSLDCAVQQTQCYQFCAESSCSAECRGCTQQKCDVTKACGGAAGVSIQNPYSCTNNDPNLMHINQDLLSLPFTGSCSRRLGVDDDRISDDVDVDVMV